MNNPNPRHNLIAVKLDSQKRIIPKGERTLVHWWRVTLGKRWTGCSKQRRFFQTEKAAKKFISEMVEAVEARGHSAFQISPKLATEAMELETQLKPYGASLTDAVKLFLNHAARGSGKTLNELIPSYLRTKNNPDYRRAQEISLRLFARHFGNDAVSKITAASIEEWLDSKQWKPLNRNNYHRDLSMFFRWAKLHGRVADNPFDKIPRPKVPRSTPAIFTVAETRLVLKTAAAHAELELLPMMAICFFSGVRIAEVERMRWEMIDWEESEIRLPGSITKTGSPRNIEILDALRAWIGIDPPHHGEIVCPGRLRLRREELLALAGVPKKRNALRHSFASYYAAHFRDPGKLQLLLGQDTPTVLFRHYIAATRKSDAAAFFNLRPEDGGETGRPDQNGPALEIESTEFRHETAA